MTSSEIRVGKDYIFLDCEDWALWRLDEQERNILEWRLETMRKVDEWRREREAIR